jgi:hypothetical protein
MKTIKDSRNTKRSRSDYNNDNNNNDKISSYNTSNNNNNDRTVRTLLTPNTSIGQHFLKNPAVVDAIVAKSHIQSGMFIVFKHNSINP